MSDVSTPEDRTAPDPSHSRTPSELPPPAPLLAGAPHDATWFETVFRAYAPRVQRYFLRRADASDAEDLTAEVFATAWRRRRDVPDEAVLPWLYRTAGLTLANHRRKARPLPLADHEEVDDTDPAQLTVADDGARRALAALSPRDRRILLAAAWEGMAGQELADYLGISRGGADAALSRARARLREAWAGGSGGTP